MTLPHSTSLASTRWTVRAVGDLSHVPAEVRGRVIPATVPGCIHTDLIDAGLIRDPRLSDAEAACQWVSWTDWRYEAEFEVDEKLLAHDEIDLAFDHLDTIAVIELNGHEVGRAMSEFLPWRFPVRDVVRAGRNTIAVTFTSPLRYVKEEAARLGARPVNGDYPAYNMIRKCASNFEWDWGPRVATCGIAGDARVEGWSVVRLDRVDAIPSRADDGSWRLDVRARLNGSRAAHGRHLIARTTFLAADKEATAQGLSFPIAQAGGGTAVCAVADINADEWSPWTFTKPTTHQITFEVLVAETGQTLVQHTFSVGLRSTDLDTRNGACALRINDRPVYCRGANWIPEGLFPRDRTPERVRERLQQLKDANMNMVRVWGGGRYEPDWFYDICDELGIMVWQDFMFACACYPEEEPIRSLVEQEARYHVARLARHPSVVLWCGGNECTWAHESWGFKEKLAPGQTWGEKYYNEILRNACSEVNPSVPYIPNSPFSPVAGMHPNDPSHGDTHTWDVWGDGYRTVTPRFCSEFGQQGPSNIETLRQADLMQPGRAGDLVPPLLTARQRGPGGNKRWYDDPIATWFRPPRDFDEWHSLAQLLQARSLAIGIEWQRANMAMGGCMGSLIWQLNDAWPGLSWSLIDAAGRPKVAYHAVQQAFRPRMLTIQPIGGGHHVIAINDSDEEYHDVLDIRRMGLDGAARASMPTSTFAVPPRTAARVAVLDDLIATVADPTTEFVLASTPHSRATWFHAPDKDLCYHPPRMDIETRSHPHAGHGHARWELVARARTVIRDLTVQWDRADGTLQSARYTPLLLPGESVHLMSVEQRTADAPPPLHLAAPPFTWCANHFGRLASPSTP